MTALDAPRPNPETEHLPNTERQAEAGKDRIWFRMSRGWESGFQTELDVAMIGLGNLPATQKLDLSSEAPYPQPTVKI